MVLTGKCYAIQRQETAENTVQGILGSASLCPGIEPNIRTRFFERFAAMASPFWLSKAHRTNQSYYALYTFCFEFFGALTKNRVKRNIKPKESENE